LQNNLIKNKIYQVTIKIKNMKTSVVINSIAFVIIIFFTSLNSFSQSKTAHINYNQLLLSMPETKQADSLLKKLTQVYQAELTRLESEYKVKVDKYQKEEKTLPEATKQLRLSELKDAETAYNKFKEAAQKDISEKDTSLFNPIFEKAKKVVTEVATSKGYDYVIDSSKAQYVYMNPKDDLMELVKKKLVK
jgi:outer membrane protein